MNIFGKYFDDNEKVLKSLTKIYGIGRLTAEELGMQFGIGSNSKVKDLSKEMWSRIVQVIEIGPNSASSSLPQPKVEPLFKKASLTILKNAIADRLVKPLGLAGQSKQPFKQDSCIETRFVVNKQIKQTNCETRALAKIRDNIDLAKKIKSYRGLRHLEGLPCRGQRTHTNALTARKKRRSV